MPFSPNQQRVMAHGTAQRGHVLQLIGGATRSGKTFCCLHAFAAFCALRTALRAPEEVDFALLGLTSDVVWRNTGAPLAELLERLGCHGRREGQQGAHFISIKTPHGGRGRIWLFGTGVAERGREEWMRGASFQGYFADECAQMSRETWAMLNSRMDRADVRGWATFNPGHPTHWFKTEVLADPDAWLAEVIQFTFDDNPTLDAETQARFRRQFRGPFAARMLHGEWAALSGLIFPFWHEPPEELRYAHLKRFRYQVGAEDTHIARVWALDYGLSTTMAVLAARPAVAERLAGSKQYDFRTRWVVDREYYYNAREAGRSRTEAEHLKHLRAMIPSNSVLVIDPSTPLPFRAQLKQHWIVRLGFNEDVLEGLVRTSAALANKVLMIDADAAPSLVGELGAYRWKEETDEDQPAKFNDHAVDALRYLACWIEKYSQVDLSMKQPMTRTLDGPKVMDFMLPNDVTEPPGG